MNLKSWGLIVLGLVSSFSMSADVLSPADALSRALASENTPNKVKARAREEFKLVKTQDDALGVPALYVFNAPDVAQGFLVVSADSSVDALLGYGDNAATSEADVNPEFAWWLSEYARQIEWNRANGVQSNQVARANSFTTIAPMVKTKWNQDAPYNDLCPLYNGSRSVTGCVATATSQVMKYYEWPKKPSGTISYTTNTYKIKINENLSTMTFDWANMLDTYDSSATSTQKTAVATLMYAVGLASQMDYSPYESAASDVFMSSGLVNNLGYQPGIINYTRDYYPFNEWENLVYSELQNGPVCYSGQSIAGGHAFVCDGYNNGYFHINWGWGGMSDGYFLLSALTPPAQGIGGSSSGYNFMQAITGRLRPNDGRAVQDVIPTMIADGFTCTTTNASQITKAMTVSFGDMVFSITAPTITCRLGVRATDASGKEYFLQSVSVNKLPSGYGYNQSFSTSYSSLPDGTYKLDPVTVDEAGNMYEVNVKSGVVRTTGMTLKNGVATFATSNGVELAVSGLKANSEFYISSYFSLSFTVTNTGESDYVGYVWPVFVNSSNSVVAYGAQEPVYLAAGETLDVDSYVSNWYTSTGKSPSAGSYKLCVIDENGKVISDMLSITANAAATPVIAVNGFKIIGDATNVPKDNLQFTVNVSCRGGYFANSLMLYIFPYKPGQTVTSVAAYYSDPVFLAAGESAAINFSEDFSQGVEGEQYYAAVYYNNRSATSTQIVFTLGGQSGIGDAVVADSEVISTEIYTLSGVKVANDNVAPGLYVVRKTMSDGSVKVEKISVK